MPPTALLYSKEQITAIGRCVLVRLGCRHGPFPFLVGLLFLFDSFFFFQLLILLLLKTVYLKMT